SRRLAPFPVCVTRLTALSLAMAARPGEACDEAQTEGLPACRHDDRDCARCLLGGKRRDGTSGDDQIDIETHELSRQVGKAFSVAVGRAIFERVVPTFDISVFAQPLPERLELCGIKRRRHHFQHADAIHLRLLRTRRERPRGSAAEKRDEVASLHSNTSSARASSVGGTSRPSALAVLRLITSSYLVGAWTGRSAGFSPVRMRSMYAAARRNISTGSAA